MKTRKIMASINLISVLCLCGCCAPQKEKVSNPIDQSQVDRAIVGIYSDMAIQNAIIAQHTLYPYHFVNNSANLNTIGERDLSVLIAHFLNNPGKLIVQQGAADDLLYQSRAQLVYEKLLAGGIVQEKINITDGMPGGDGMPSGSVIEILEKAKTKPDISHTYDGTRVQF